MEGLRGNSAVLIQLKQFTVKIIGAALGDHFDNSRPTVFGGGVGRAHLELLNGRDGLRQSLQFIGVAFGCRHAVHQIIDGSSGQTVHSRVALPLACEVIGDDAWRKIQNV